MTTTDKIIGALIEPFCHAENAARRVFHWCAEKALDRHVLAISRRISKEEDE